MKKISVAFILSFVFISAFNNYQQNAVAVESWQLSGFNSPASNYLPPPSEFGFTSWDEDNHLYKIQYDFIVTGLSNGVGN